MNFINCSNQLSPDIMRKTVAFWSENSYQHISSLLKAPQGTTAVLQDEFKEKLQNYYQKFKEMGGKHLTGGGNDFYRKIGYDTEVYSLIYRKE